MTYGLWSHPASVELLQLQWGLMLFRLVVKGAGPSQVHSSSREQSGLRCLQPQTACLILPLLTPSPKPLHLFRDSLGQERLKLKLGIYRGGAGRPCLAGTPVRVTSRDIAQLLEVEEGQHHQSSRVSLIPEGGDK